MTEALRLIVHTVGGGSYILVALVALTAGVITTLWIEIALGLRAKRRAQYIVQQAKREAEFQDLVKRALFMKLAANSNEMELLKRSVEAHLKQMSAKDKVLVHQGLNQRSRQGSERYLKELVGSDAA